MSTWFGLFREWNEGTNINGNAHINILQRAHSYSLTQNLLMNEMENTINCKAIQTS